MRRCLICSKSDTDVEFYNGIYNWCKEHWKERVRANRASKADQYRSYDRQRADLPHRVFARRLYAKTQHGRIAGNNGKRLYIERNPMKRAAHIAVGNALRDGKLLKQPCDGCGNRNAQAHHDDYSKPLEVRWLCPMCHTNHHKTERQKNRAKLTIGN